MERRQARGSALCYPKYRLGKRRWATNNLCNAYDAALFTTPNQLSNRCVELFRKTLVLRLNTGAFEANSRSWPSL
jgi:hypothetical protein